MKEKSVKTEYLLCIFLGIFGIHKFYKGKILLGILYLFTYGLFFVGWIIDIVILTKRMFFKNEQSNRTNIEVEKYPLQTPPEILNDMKKYYNKLEIPNLLRILEDCKYLVTTSKSIDTVMSRLELGAEKAFTLKQLEKIKFYKNKPSSDDYLDFFIGQKEELINACLRKAYDDVKLNASQLKTEKGKINRYKKFIESLHKYDDEFYDTINEEFVFEVEEELNQKGELMKNE